MSDWSIPGGVNELFANVPNSYHIIDRDYPGDNVYGMRLFLDAVGVPSEMIEYEGGTQVTLRDGERLIVIDSGGLGDFHMHRFDVTEG